MFKHTEIKLSTKDRDKVFYLLPYQLVFVCLAAETPSRGGIPTAMLKKGAAAAALTKASSPYTVNRAQKGDWAAPLQESTAPSPWPSKLCSPPLSQDPFLTCPSFHSHSYLLSSKMIP